MSPVLSQGRAGRGPGQRRSRSAGLTGPRAPGFYLAPRAIEMWVLLFPVAAFQMELDELTGTPLRISMSLKRINCCFQNRKITISFSEVPAPLHCLPLILMGPSVPSASGRHDVLPRRAPVGCPSGMHRSSCGRPLVEPRPLLVARGPSGVWTGQGLRAWLSF